MRLWQNGVALFLGSGYMALRKHQLADLGVFLEKRKFIDGSKPGTGKTPTACVLARAVWEEEGIKTVWVNGLKSILGKNRLELLKHGEFSPEEVAIVDTTPAKREAIFRDPRVKVFIMGADCFANNWEKMVQINPQIRCLIYDEIHMACGNLDTKRSKAVLKATQKQFTWFLAMSGSLVDGKLSSVYVPLKVVDPLAYPTYQNFLNNHAVLDVYGNVKQWYNHEHLRRVMKKNWVCHSFEEVYGKSSEDLIHREMVDMSPDMRKPYSDMEKMAYAELDGMSLTAVNEGVNLLRCRQLLLCPEVFDPNITRLKDEALMAHLVDAESNKTPIMICGSYVQEQKRLVRLAQEAGLKPGLMNGEVSAKQRDVLNNQFVDGSVNVMIGSPQVMAVGYNWEHVDHVIFHSLTYKDSDFIQAIRRANRGTRSKPLRVTILEYENSIEEKVWWIIHRKSEEAARVDPSYPVIRETEG